MGLWLQELSLTSHAISLSLSLSQNSGEMPCLQNPIFQASFHKR